MSRSKDYQALERIRKQKIQPMNKVLEMTAKNRKLTKEESETQAALNELYAIAERSYSTLSAIESALEDIIDVTDKKMVQAKDFDSAKRMKKAVSHIKSVLNV
jgi:uncharacterized protein YnzC (UPF0291/DUF896 family)